MIEIKNRVTGAVLHTVEADTLRGADLSRAGLYEADLSGADLSRADLYEADLYEADLRGADLRGADLRGADLRGATGVKCLGTDRRGYRFVAIRWEDGWRILAGCRWFTIAEALAHWGAKSNKDALARVAVAIAED